MSDEMKQSAELFAQDVFEYSKLLAENADLRARLEKALHDKDVEQKKAVTLFDAYEAAKAWLDKTEQERDSRITEEHARLREGAEEKVRNLLFEHVDRTVADISRFELSRLIVSALFGEGGK
jgi:16S rRNA U516 pseudouridylate synthase RsuA-like enzyme